MGVWQSLRVCCLVSYLVLNANGAEAPFRRKFCFVVLYGKSGFLQFTIFYLPREETGWCLIELSIDQKCNFQFTAPRNRVVLD